jgi:hypothetical protein
LNQVKFKGAMKVGHLVAVMRPGGDSLSPEQHRPMTGLSQNKTWLSRSRLGDQVQRSDSKHTRTRKNRQVLRGTGWGQGLRKQ